MKRAANILAGSAVASCLLVVVTGMYPLAWGVAILAAASQVCYWRAER